MAIVREIYDKSELLRQICNGEIVCIPTDTLYAMSGDATNYALINKIFKIKQRPQDKVFPLFVHSLAMVKQYAQMPLVAQKLAHQFWPGPITLVLPAFKGCGLDHLIKDDYVAFRIPNHNLILDICQNIGRPIVGTSANVMGQCPVSNFSELQEQINKSKYHLVDDIAVLPKLSKQKCDIKIPLVQNSNMIEDVNLTEELDLTAYSVQNVYFYVSSDCIAQANYMTSKDIVQPKPSTVVKISAQSEIFILREGAINEKEILSFLSINKIANK